jgi:hypothetical protein
MTTEWPPTRWTTTEENQLRSMVSAGDHIDKIAKQLKRTPEAVRTRAYKLRLRLGYPHSKKPR